MKLHAYQSDSIAVDVSLAMFLVSVLLFSVFKGTHKALTMIDPVTKKSWQVPLTQTPGYKNQPSYHPRWSNHPRFLTMTGPYPPPKKKKLMI